MSGSDISWAICKSAPHSRQITTPAPHHSVFYRPDALPVTQPTASKHWRPHTIYTNYTNSELWHNQNISWQQEVAACLIGGGFEEFFSTLVNTIVCHGDVRLNRVCNDKYKHTERSSRPGPEPSSVKADVYLRTHSGACQKSRSSAEGKMPICTSG